MPAAPLNDAPLPDVSIVVPVFHEEGAAPDLAREIAAAFAGSAFEMIFVDDASKDGTVAALQALRAGFPQLRVLVHAKNAGQSRAVRTGCSRRTRTSCRHAGRGWPERPRRCAAPGCAPERLARAWPRGRAPRQAPGQRGETLRVALWKRRQKAAFERSGRRYRVWTEGFPPGQLPASAVFRPHAQISARLNVAGEVRHCFRGRESSPSHDRRVEIQQSWASLGLSFRSLRGDVAAGSRSKPGRRYRSLRISRGCGENATHGNFTGNPWNQGEYAAFRWQSASLSGRRRVFRAPLAPGKSPSSDGLFARHACGVANAAVMG